MCVCAACVHACVRVCACVRVRVGECVCARERARALRIVSMDKILDFIITFIVTVKYA